MGPALRSFSGVFSRSVRRHCSLRGRVADECVSSCMPLGLALVKRLQSQGLWRQSEDCGGFADECVSSCMPLGLALVKRLQSQGLWRQSEDCGGPNPAEVVCFACLDVGACAVRPSSGAYCQVHRGTDLVGVRCLNPLKGSVLSFQKYWLQPALV